MKYHNTKNILITITLILCLFNFISNSTNASEPNIIELSLDPVEPKPMSAINFTAKIVSDDDIESVRIIVTECLQGMCSAFNYNESLNRTTNNSYEGQVLLTRNDAIKIKYRLEILSNGAWYVSNTSFYDLNTTGFNYTKEDKEKLKSTPGFELILMLFSIILTLFLKKRKL